MPPKTADTATAHSPVARCGDTVPIRLIRAPNPSPLTGSGTNTWIVGAGDVTVIDPGPALPDHQSAILAALGPTERVAQIIVTHAHLDHSALARPLAKAVGAPILAFGSADAGRSAVMQRLLETGFAGGGEGADTAFHPDMRLTDGQNLPIPGTDLGLEVIHTPGHMGGHISLALGDVLFSGDHVMGWASTLISPPDGDMGAYMASLARLQKRDWSRFLPGHGPIIDAPAARLADLTAHRMSREAAILAALSDAPADATDLAARIYHDTAPNLLPAARRNVLSHLIDLAERNRVTTKGLVTGDSVFHLT